MLASLSYFVLLSILNSWQFNIISIHNPVLVYFFCLLLCLSPEGLCPSFPLHSFAVFCVASSQVVIKWGCVFEGRICRLISLYSCGYLLVYMFFLPLPLSSVFHDIGDGQAREYRNADAVNNKQNWVNSGLTSRVKNQAWPFTLSKDHV